MRPIDREYVRSLMPRRDPAGHKGAFGKVYLLGGSVGALLGMHVFRHKTRHWYFRWGFALLTAAQCAIIYFILR